jgi:hypothetical protein
MMLSGAGMTAPKASGRRSSDATSRVLDHLSGFHQPAGTYKAARNAHLGFASQAPRGGSIVRGSPLGWRSAPFPSGASTARRCSAAWGTKGASDFRAPWRDYAGWGDSTNAPEFTMLLVN